MPLGLIYQLFHAINNTSMLLLMVVLATSARHTIPQLKNHNTESKTFWENGGEDVLFLWVTQMREVTPMYNLCYMGINPIKFGQPKVIEMIHILTQFSENMLKCENCLESIMLVLLLPRQKVWKAQVQTLSPKKKVDFPLKGYHTKKS